MTTTKRLFLGVGASITLFLTIMVGSAVPHFPEHGKLLAGLCGLLSALVIRLISGLAASGEDGV